MNKIKIIFLTIITLIPLIFNSFDVKNLHSYNFIYFDIYNFYPIFKTNSNLFNKKKETTSDKTTSIINKQNRDSANFLATLFFSPTFFEYYRKSTRKGFTKIAKIKFKTGNYNFVFYQSSFIDSFFYKIKIKFKITKTIINYTQAILNTSGIKSSGSFSFNIENININNFDIKENIFIYLLKKACENLIENTVFIKYGRNFLYKVTGSFILTQPPLIMVNSGIIYIKVIGYIIFNNEE